MNILVTGGAGFIGSHLVDALVARGHSVKILDALVPQVHAKAPDYLNPDAQFIGGDVCDRETAGRALEGIEVVYHQAAEVGVAQSMYEIQKYVRANQVGTAVLLEAIIERRASIAKLIVASSNTIYGEGAYHCPSCGVIHPQLRPARQLLARRWEACCLTCDAPLSPRATGEDRPLSPTTVYAITKQNQEQLCLVTGRAYSIPVVALRYFNVYGTRQALSNPYTGVCAIFSARLLNDQPPVIFEDGLQTRDFTHVTDIVQANLRAIETDAADYTSINIGTGRATSIKEVALLLARGLGKDIEPEIVGRYREGDIRHCFADIARARRLLGYEPKIAIEQGVPELIDWVRNQTAQDRLKEATGEMESRRLVK